MSRHYCPGDCVLAVLDSPDLALSLTFTHAAQWRVMVFDLAEKRAALAEHLEPSLDRAKQFVLRFVAERFGRDLSGLPWREVLVPRGSGPAG